MTHYMVTVRVTAERLTRHGGDLDAALAEMLAPYDEQTEERRFQEFCGDEDGDRTHKGKRGYWRNPNAKWDWYAIGGRGTGYFPVKPGATVRVGKPGLMTPPASDGRSDVARAGDIDMDAVTNETRAKADAFADRYARWLVDPASFKKEDPFGDVRSRAMRLGLVRVSKTAPDLRPEERAFPWATLVDDRDERRAWFDVAKPLTSERLAELLPAFCPIASYAALDDAGWHAPGEVGWFGCSDETPDDLLGFKAAFAERFLRAAAPTDLLVAVDCHI